MNFPKHFDRGDFVLFLKEAKLAGLVTQEYFFQEEGFYQVVYLFERHEEPKGTPTVDPYLRRRDGYWVRVKPGTWEELISEAERYEVS